MVAAAGSTSVRRGDDQLVGGLGHGTHHAGPAAAPRPRRVPAVAFRGADDDDDPTRIRPLRMSAEVPTEGPRAASEARRGLAGRVLGDRYRVVRMVSAGASTLIADAEDTSSGGR